MWIFVAFLVGGLIFGILGFAIGNSKSNSKSDSKETKENKERVKEYTRRGIWSNGYSMGNGENKRSFDVQFELGELESTSTKSKVEVISMVASRSECNDNQTKQKLAEMVNYTWMLSSDIEWIDDTTKMRNDKIDQILNGK